MDLTRSRIAPFLLGFFLVANLFVVPGAASSPRATDVAGLGLAVWLLMLAHRRGVPTGPLAALGLACVMPLVWLGWGVLEGQMPTVSQSARWILALPWAMALLLVTRSREARVRLVWGLIVGNLLGVAVVLMQFVGLEGVLQRVGLSASDAAFHHYVYHQVRIPGMHVHPNASSAVTSLLAPSAMYLYLRHHGRFWLPVVCLLGMMLAMHLTSTRSPLVVTVPVVLLAMVVARNPARALPLFVSLSVGGVLFLAVFGPPGGAARWGDMLALQANAGERVISNQAAIEVMLHHPLGLGVVGGKTAMVEACAIEATHNAFLQAGVFFGTPLAAMLLVAMVVHAWRMVVDARGAGLWLGLLSVQTAGLFMFEEHLTNPSFVIIALWLLAAAVDGRQPDRNDS